MPAKRARKSKTAIQLPGYTYGRIVTRGMGTQTLLPGLPANFNTYRTIRKQPTIAFARTMAIAPIISCEWSVEGPDASDEIIEQSQELVNELKDVYLKHTVARCYDYGWAAMEQWYDPDYKLHLKPLSNDLSLAAIDEYGEFQGVWQDPEIKLAPEECVFVAINCEAGSIYGSGYLENLRSSYAQWLETNAGLDRYSRKIAGSHWIVQYPNGTYVDESGTTLDNSHLAQHILADLESSGAVALPVPVAQYVEDLNKSANIPSWKVELLSDSSPRQGSFIEALRYIDNLFVRGFNLPERSVLEGQFGTKAESGTQKDFALIQMDLMSLYFAKEFERQVLLPYLNIVAGEASVIITPSAINPDALNYQRSIATKLMTQDMVDMDAMLDFVKIPKRDNIVEVQDKTLEQENVNEFPGTE